MKNKLLISLITIVVFLFLYYLKYVYAYWIIGVEEWNSSPMMTREMLISIPKLIIVFATTWWLTKRPPMEALGLDRGLIEGFNWALLFSLPMFIGYGITGSISLDFGGEMIYKAMVSAGFGEEFLFRAFLFGVLFYYAGWGFIPATLIASVFFGLGHLYQANDIGSALGVFAFTALGSVGFALFYVAWKSLWMPLLLHGFMDLAWDMFSVQTDVRGDLTANLFRFCTLGLAIFFTARKLKKENPGFLKGKVWINKGI